MMASLALKESFMAHLSTQLLASAYFRLKAMSEVPVMLEFVASVCICATGVSKISRDRCRYMMVGCSNPPAPAALLLARQCNMSRQSHALLRHFDSVGSDGGHVSANGLCWASRI